MREELGTCYVSLFCGHHIQLSLEGLSFFFDLLIFGFFDFYRNFNIYDFVIF